VPDRHHEAVIPLLARMGPAALARCVSTPFSRQGCEDGIAEHQMANAMDQMTWWPL